MTNMASIANSRSYVAHDHYCYYCCWYHGISARTGNIDGSYRKDHQYKNRFLMWNPVMLGILTISHQVAMLLLYTAYLHTSGAFVIIIIITEQWACCTAWTLNIYIIFMSENAMYCYWRTYQCILKTSFFFSSAEWNKDCRSRKRIVANIYYAQIIMFETMTNALHSIRLFGNK